MNCPNCNCQLVRIIDQTSGKNGVETGDRLYKGLILMKSNGGVTVKCPMCKEMVELPARIMLVKQGVEKHAD